MENENHNNNKQLMKLLQSNNDIKINETIHENEKKKRY